MQVRHLCLQTRAVLLLQKSCILARCQIAFKSRLLRQHCSLCALFTKDCHPRTRRRHEDSAVLFLTPDSPVHLHAAGLSQNVGSKPVGVEMLSEKIVLFRDNSGQVVAINDVCPHRGAPLHEGAPPANPDAAGPPSRILQAWALCGFCAPPRRTQH